MNATDVQEKLLSWTVAHSGAEQRTYLGMSRISDCSLSLYRELSTGGLREWTIASYLNCYAGYLWERDIKERLAAIGLYTPGSEREVVAQFDSRFRGHTDGTLTDGRLLEIKSTVQTNLADIMSTQRIPRRNFEQVQVYLRHGGFSSAVVVYVARDTGNLHVAEIHSVPSVQANLDAKAKRILDALDKGFPPACECRRCK